jgi:hypothetical protein
MLVGALLSPFYMCAHASRSTNFTILYAPVPAGALISPFYQEHQFRDAICTRASGSTTFIVLYTPALAGAPMSPPYQGYQSRHAIRARTSGITNFTVPYTPVLAGARNSPFYQEQCAMLCAPMLTGTPVSTFYARTSGSTFQGQFRHAI